LPIGHFAVVGCVGGIGAWHGKGTGFESLPSLEEAPLDPFSVALDPHLVVRTFDGLFESLDSGATFKKLAVSGPLDVVNASWFALADVELLAERAGVVYAAPAGTGAFVQRSKVGAGTFSYNDGVLVRSPDDGSSLSVSSDSGRSFLEITATDASLKFGSTSVYSAGYLYSMSARDRCWGDVDTTVMLQSVGGHSVAVEEQLDEGTARRIVSEGAARRVHDVVARHLP